MKVLMAIDGSRPSRHAVDEVLRLMPEQLKQADVLLVDILPSLDAFELAGTGYDPAELEAVLIEEEAAEAERSLLEAECRLAAAGVKARHVEGIAHPAAGILKVAREFQPDLVVLGTHGRGPALRLLEGSVSEAVLHQWPGAVLLVPQRGSRKPAA